MNLSPAELIDLTGKVRPHAQARVLDYLGIPYKQRPDRTLVVYRDHHKGANDGSIQREPRLRLVNGPKP